MSDALQELKSNTAAAGILLDFDGTLSEIVFIPSDARPYTGVTELLRRLAVKYRTVSIVSGRSAHDLLEWLGPDLDIWGVHGAQRVRDGRVELSSIALPYEEKMQQVLAEAREEVSRHDLPGVVIENKGVMVGLHFRAAEDRAVAQSTLDRIAADLAERHGLIRAGGRLAFELRPAVPLSKKSVVLQVAREAELRAILYAGDDVVDLPGFDALDELERSGVAALRVGVRSDEAPPELLARADVVVDGPAGMVELLATLV